MSSSSALPPSEHELKFHVPKHKTEGLRQWLNLAFRPHPAHATSTVCSIYFDTPQGRSLDEKAHSDFAKTKYRVRWYADSHGNPLPVPAYIEIKEKRGGTRFKYRSVLPHTPIELMATPLEDCLFSGLFLRHFSSGTSPFIPLLRPVLELHYTRDRYIHSCFAESFCLDSSIRCTRTRQGTFPSAPVGAFTLPFDVFEQKGTSPQPVAALQPLPRFDAQRSAISKYYETQRHLLPDHEHA